MKTTLGLDLGTNSIGWALVDKENKKILGMGSRIIPMSQDILDNFGAGKPSKTQTAERTAYRSVRRLRERHLLRRERLHRVLNRLGFLPEHYAIQIDFEKRLGKFKEEAEPKLVYQEIWSEDKGKNEYNFIFKKSFEEMLSDFRKHQPQLLENDRKIPYDWTIYYLRKKALTKKIEREELAWIILNFNQKRGYYQLRSEEEEENPNKLVEFHSLKVIDVQADEQQKGKPDIWYSIILENSWIYRRSSKTPLFDWKDKIRDFIVTTDLNDDGTIKTDKEGKEKRSFRAPGEDDWTLIKKKTETEIDNSDQTVGAYIYDNLLKNPKQKIKGKLVRTIERKFYKDELKQILQKQKEFHPGLKDDNLYNDCVRELYKNNEAHQLLLSKRDFVHLFLDDILFYQRPLKSQKSSIGNCSLEYKKFKLNGEEKIQYIKAIPKSHPLYQEFRLWQWIYNLRIHKKDNDCDVTGEFLNNLESFEKLFEFLNNREEIEQKALLKYFKLKDKTHRWNFVEDKKYPCNETRTLITTRLSKVGNLQDNFLTDEAEQHLWHIIYSVTDKTEYEKALKTYAEKHELEVSSFVENFKKFPPFKSDYGSYSAKAIKKLLPLMRTGKYWKWDNIDEKNKNRISKIITGEYDEEIKNRVRERAIHLMKESHFQGLQLWLASYIVYGRHSEAAIPNKWESVADLKAYLQEFKQHSLRNPIVEQVVTETLRVVNDIWQQYGNGATDFFDEIHIELGREMKNTAEDRERMTNQITENENTNLRIKALLAELKNDGSIENVRPYSPTQQEILKIFEDGILSSDIEIPDDIVKISKTAQPSSSELQRYKLWLEQKYRSPYTGLMIPLNKLFTADYEIEHIIPQSRYFDDSFNNKVISEAAVNKLKDNQIGLEFINNHHGEIVQTGLGKSVKIFEVSDYEDFVKTHYVKNRSKRNKLLMEDIPEKMIERQLNDTRYISKFVSSVLSNIVRSDKNDDGVNSKNLIPGNGKITARLKQDWGLNDVWNDLILPRFERMNELTNSTAFTSYNEKYQKYLPTVPIELSKNFQKKRIDHRHHALDALIIACATRDHVNLLNNKYAKSNERFDLNRKLRKFEKVAYNHPKTGERIKREVPTDFLKPWNNFTLDVKNELEKIVVSFKQNLRVINKTSNKYESYKDENGNLRIGKDGKSIKKIISQIKGDSWAIRKSLHTPMPYSKKTYGFDILKISDNIGKREYIVDDKIRTEVEELYMTHYSKVTDTRKYLKENPILDENGNQIISTAFKIKSERFRRRQPISELSNRGQGGIKTVEDAKKIIDKIADNRIREDLLQHLKDCNNDLEKAFNAEGLENFNSRRKTPIYKLPIAESGTGRFAVGNTVGTRHKWVEADKGTNLFFAVYENEEGNRNYETLPLNEVIEHQKWWATLSSKEKRNTPLISIKAEKGKFLFSLSPNDLVYVPTADERENFSWVDFNNLKKEQLNNIYKVVSFTGSQCFFVRQDVATSIVNKIEFSTLNKMEKSINEVMIKECCIKLNVDRLGNISKAKI